MHVQQTAGFPDWKETTDSFLRRQMVILFFPLLLSFGLLTHDVKNKTSALNWGNKHGSKVGINV